jgi:PAS domain S-box-containing protein
MEERPPSTDGGRRMQPPMNQEDRPIGAPEDVLDRVSDGFFAVDADWRVTYVNRAGEEFLGVTGEDLVGEVLWEAFPGAVGTEFYDAYHRAVETGEPVTFESHYEPLDSWFEVRAFPSESGLSVYFRDVTDRRRMETALRREKSLLERVFETTPVALVVVDGEGEIVRANDRAETLLGVTHSEITGRTYDHPDWRLFDEDGDELDGEDLPVARVFETGEAVFGAEHGIEHPDGSRLWLSVNAVPHTDVDGTVRRVVAAFEDVTDRRDREAELESANRQFEVLNRILRHDVRNDVGVVLGWAELLGERLDDEESLELLSRIQRTARDALHLTETGKDVIEVLSTEGQVPLEPVAVGNVLGDELAKHREMYPDAEFRVDGDLPGPEVTVEANEMLSSVVGNVLTNAVQHNDTDEPTVEVGVEITEEAVTIRIADDGPGLAPDEEAVFDPGHRGLDSEGTGLGLYLVDELVSRYGGTVRVAENDPRGTVFSIELNRP